MLFRPALLQLSLVGVYRSADASGAKSSTPPTTRTIPLFKVVEVWNALPSAMPWTEFHEFVAGS
jgi:hypothetical protein